MEARKLLLLKNKKDCCPISARLDEMIEQLERNPAADEDLYLQGFFFKMIEARHYWDLYSSQFPEDDNEGST